MLTAKLLLDAAVGYSRRYANYWIPIGGSLFSNCCVYRRIPYNWYMCLGCRTFASR